MGSAPGEGGVLIFSLASADDVTGWFGGERGRVWKTVRPERGTVATDALGGTAEQVLAANQALHKAGLRCLRTP